LVSRPKTKKRTRSESVPVGRGLARFVDSLPLVLLLAVSMILRFVLAHRNDLPSVDGCIYMEQASWLVAHGQLIFSTFPPGWPLLTVPALFLLGLDDPIAPLRAAQIMNVLLGTAFGWLTWCVLRAEVERRVALVGTALALFLPQVIRLSTGDMSDMSFACALAGCWLLSRGGRHFATGLLFGYAYLIRPEALLVAGGLMLLHFLRERRPPWRMAVGIAVPVIPYLLFLRHMTGEWSLSSKAYFLEKTLNEHQGGAYLQLILDNLGVHLPLVVQVLGVPLVVLVLVGAVARPGRWLLFMTPALLPPLFSFAMASRYWVVLIPFLFLGAVKGGRWLLERASLGRNRPAVLLLIAISTAGVMIASVDEFSGIGDLDENYEGLKDSGLMLRDKIEPGESIASYKPYPSFWAGCRFTKIPEDMTALEILDYCRDEGAAYLVVNVHVAFTLRPALHVFLQVQLPPELQDQVTRLGVVSYDSDHRQDTVVYRINPRP